MSLLYLLNQTLNLLLYLSVPIKSSLVEFLCIEKLSFPQPFLLALLAVDLSRPSADEYWLGDQFKHVDGETSDHNAHARVTN